ncbi:MAG: hypothetical protein M9921_09375 [Fimbriimonadaceae bacterium]|nr:hypothetical protein [Fimbriimonadaceae bacterium]
MDPGIFAESTTPPEGPPAVRALWHDAHDEWGKAHALVQDDPGREAALVHAYLHRKEGDLDNARYWYTRTGASVFSGSFQEEWTHLVQELT